MWMRIKMKNLFIALLFVLSTVAFSKTWEANLEMCSVDNVEDVVGFWFPNHNWTDKGEPWIKPYKFGEDVWDYDENVISFNFEASYYCEGCDWENPFNIRYTLPSDGETFDNDTVYFFMDCLYNSSGRKVGREELSLEDVLNRKFMSAEIFIECSTNVGFSHDIDGFYNKCNDGYYWTTGIYFIYKKYSDKFEYNALCNIRKMVFPFYDIQCVFQDDGTLNFEKIPDVRTIPNDSCEIKLTHSSKLTVPHLKSIFANTLMFKINGTPATKNSSNIVIQNKQPVLQLKGER